MADQYSISPGHLVSPGQNKAKLKPKPEEIITSLLPHGRREDALHFLAWLRENKLSPKWCSTNKWRFDYKGKSPKAISLGYLFVRGNSDGDINKSVWGIMTRKTTSGVQNKNCPYRHPSCSDCYGVCGHMMKELIAPDITIVEELKSEILTRRKSLVEKFP